MSKIDQLNKQIENEDKDYERYHQQKQKELETLKQTVENLIAEMDQKRNEHYRKVGELQQERDAVALEEKLKGFPQHLTEGHKFCSVCGGAMRPFETAEGKSWACQNGNLQIGHDLVKV